MRTFKIDLQPFTELTTETTENGRWYTTPTGKRYPSVTTVLKRCLPTDWLDLWKERVGEEEAYRVTERSKTRGNSIHKLMEGYLRGYPQPGGIMPINLDMFRKLCTVLDRRVRVVHGVEFPVWSDRLQLAGRVDLWGIFDEYLSVADLKGANKPSGIEKLVVHFVQASAYAIMLSEALDISIEKVAVMVVPEHEAPEVHVRSVAAWREAVETVFSLDKRREIGLL